MLNHSIFNITGSTQKYDSARAENLAINVGRRKKKAKDQVELKQASVVSDNKKIFLDVLIARGSPGKPFGHYVLEVIREMKE